MPTGIYIRTKQVWNKGKKGVQIGWSKGKKLSPLHIKHLSESHKGLLPGYWKGKERPEMRKPFTEEHKKKIGDSMRGKPALKISGSKSHLWKGGIYPLHKKIRKTLEYRMWRRSVFDRDNYTCIWCGARSGDGKKIILQADHIKPFALYPALRFAIDNGRTLCLSCHRKTDTYGGKCEKKPVESYQFPA